MITDGSSAGVESWHDDVRGPGSIPGRPPSLNEENHDKT